MAALPSFFLPGLGQAIKGQVGKGVAIWLGLIVFFLASFVLVGLPFLIVLLLWQIDDAYNLPQTQ